jgi:hypothetical protein
MRFFWVGSDIEEDDRGDSRGSGQLYGGIAVPYILQHADFIFTDGGRAYSFCTITASGGAAADSNL